MNGCRRTPLLIAIVLAALPATQAAGTSVDVDGRQWTAATNGADLPWPEADAYCRGLDLDGHRDWRLPTLSELESLHDPAAAETGHVRAPLQLDGCCIWSATSLAERPADEGDATANAPELYQWGFLFDGGIRYYSFRRFADGRALCTRDP